MRRSKSSRRWLAEHFNDVYVKKAHAQGYRSRSVFKLKEIFEKDHLLKKNMRVLDLGAAPGGWTQLVLEHLKGQGKIWSLDLLPLSALPDVTFIQGDFTSEETLKLLWCALGEEAVDLILSDMAPNMSGVSGVDQPRVMYLAETVLDLTSYLLKPEGCLVIKLFQGEGYDAFLKLLRQQFKKVTIRKPAASRKRSNEIYLIAREKK
ncbi:MAG: 23S rRNA methyltransferase [Gammaproteobacteria bacterium RIFCSPHIGHO2_02_FULL_38_33]|nr:MAG: 23S rRNA methyltransferase [Gammaproteobacteria bacterium RIFCSPHIGHO2_02_FULL_38_33]OGT24772.1 MAG: 23S rRNA methyltransferase [Gammaproteobacteria bacterium RIFCSPHIGHO2_12_38_15]